MTTLVNGVIDVYHGDADAIRKRGLTLTEALRRAKAAGVRMVIAKCTQGRGDYTDDAGHLHKGYIDPSFFAWHEAAVANGLVFGAYVFPSETSPPEEQCDFALSVLANAGFDLSTTFVALDKERNPDPGGTITRDHARRWVQRFHSVTGRWPGYYSNTSDLHEDIAPDDVLRNCTLWVAAYGDFVHGDGPAAPWRWTLWQYMGAGSGPGGATHPPEWPHDQTQYPRAFDGVGQVDASVSRVPVEALVP